MSSPIAVPAANTNSQTQSAHSPNMAARSLPGSASGLYVPVHRRGGSASSISSTSSSSFLERGSLSPIARPTNPRMRSVSPMARTPRSPRAFGKHPLGMSRARPRSPGSQTDWSRTHSDAFPAPSPRAANIPLASMIPNTYTIPELLALSSSSSTLLSPPQSEQIDAHIPLMSRKPSKSSSPSSAPSSSAASSPSSTTAPLPDPAPVPVRAAKSNSTPDAQKMRRRRPGRKNSGGKPRVAPAVGADIEERRRRHGANWGWGAHSGGNAPEQESWRSHAVAVAA